MPTQNLPHAEILAQYYDLQHAEYTDDIIFWRKLAARHPGLSLELGCGTGRVLIPLAAAGHPIAGIDIDPAMLQIAKARLGGQTRQEVQLILGDMRDFRLGQTFGLIISPCNTFSTLSPADQTKTLERVQHHLATGGFFAFSVPNPQVLDQLEDAEQPEIEMVLDHPQTGNPVQVSCGWQRAGQQIRFNWYYDHLLSSGSVERVNTTVRHYLGTPAGYSAQLEGAGLKVTAQYGDFDHSAYTEESPYLICVAQKMAA